MRRSLYQLQAVGGLLAGAFVIALFALGPIWLVIIGFLMVTFGWVPLLVLLAYSLLRLVGAGVARARLYW